MTQKQKTHRLAVAAMLTAVAFVLQFIEFSIPALIPPFIKLDISDLPALLGTVFVVIAGIIYKRSKSRRSALWGSIAGAVGMAVISLPLNYFLVYPAYVVLYNLPLEAIIGMYEEILGSIAHMPSSNALFNCLLVFNVPFTLCKGALDVVLCFLIYKPLSPLLHK